MATLDDCPAVEARAAPLGVSPELANLATHAVGLLLSVMGAGVLWRAAAGVGDRWRLAAIAVYASTMVGVYAASTLSHSFRRPRPRHFFRRLDQAAIYLFIAGSYTPFALAYLRTGPWSILLWLVWGIALAGFVLKLFWGHQVESVTTGLYLMLGWLPGLAAWPLFHVIPPPGLRWMLYGGLCYTAGTFFLHMDSKVPYLHAVWHLFVMAGTAWQFFAILLCVLPVY